MNGSPPSRGAFMDCHTLGKRMVRELALLTLVFPQAVLCHLTSPPKPPPPHKRPWRWNVNTAPMFTSRGLQGITEEEKTGKHSPSSLDWSNKKFAQTVCVRVAGACSGLIRQPQHRKGVCLPPLPNLKAEVLIEIENGVTFSTTARVQ